MQNRSPDMTLLLQSIVAELQEINAGLRYMQAVSSLGQNQNPLQQQQRAQDDLTDSANVPDHSTGQPSGPAQEELAMLERFPTLDLLLSLRQDLERAIESCDCKIGGEPVSALSYRDYPPETYAVHWTFRNAILVLPTRGSSAFPRFNLHSPNLAATRAESEACRRFIQSQWPQGVVQATWKKYPEPLGTDQGVDKCLFWGLSGSSLPSTFIYQFYVRPTDNGCQLRMPRLSYPGKEPAQYVWVDWGSHPDMVQPRNPGDVHTGQVW